MRSAAKKNGAVRAKPRKVNGHAYHGDRELAELCLAGDQAAWTRFFRECQPTLLSGIRKLLGGKAADGDLAEEIAARVWLSLVKNHGELLDQFDEHRGTPLVAFVASLAKNEVLQYLRSERRRVARERVATSERKQRSNVSIGHIRAQMLEFVATLTPREREFLQFHLSGPASGEPSPFTRTNAWQLSHRVRRKLEEFVNAD